MKITTSEKIRILVKRRNMTIKELAERTEQTPQNLNNKLKRDNFTISDLEKIAAALDCTVEIIFTMNDTEKRF